MRAGRDADHDAARRPAPSPRVRSWSSRSVVIQRFIIRRAAVDVFRVNDEKQSIWRLVPQFTVGSKASYLRGIPG